MRKAMMKVQSVFLDPVALNTAFEEFLSLLKNKSYWFAFYFLGVLAALFTAFDTYRIENATERTIFIFCVITFLLLCSAVICGFFKAATGRSAQEHVDVIPKVGLICVLVATIPIRLSLLVVSDTPLDVGEIVNGFINGMAKFAVIASTFALLQFGPRTLWRSVFHTGANGTLPDEVDQIPLYIEAEDHYVKMVGSKGVKLVRANLGETSQELGPAGFRCHKSYWVSHEAIGEKRRKGRQLVLVLKNGTEIPVGRSFEKQVRSIVGQGRVFADAAE